MGARDEAMRAAAESFEHSFTPAGRATAGANESELVQLMASLSTFQGSAIVSLHGSSPADFGLRGWVRETLPDSRQSPNHDGESLWLNPQAADLRPSQRLFP